MENVGLIAGLFYVAIMVLLIASMWKTFEKAGKPGWACIIPIYSTIVLLKIVGKPWWWLLIMIFLPPVGLILAIWMTNLLSKSFGKGIGFTIGLLIPPLTFIFLPILGFGDAKYNGPAGS